MTHLRLVSSWLVPALVTGCLGQRVDARDRSEPAPIATHARFVTDRDRYLRETLRPRVKACWATLEGEGEIRFFYTMRAASLTGETTLTPSVEAEIGHDAPVGIVESTLTAEQSRQALACMLDAFEGTSFTTVLPMPELGTMVGFDHAWRVGEAARARLLD